MDLTRVRNQRSKVKTTAKNPLAAWSILSFKLWFLLFTFNLLAVTNLFAASATAEKAMVVTQHPLATEAALDVLKRGGNAADAAITAQLVLNVVEPHGSGLGGGGFFLYYDHIQRSVLSYDAREAAPASAKPDMFMRNGTPIPFFPERISGGLSVGVPGTPALIQKIYDKHASGLFSLEELVAPAAQLAREGVPVSKKLGEYLSQHAERLRQFPETKKIFFHGDQPLQEGNMLIQTDLADTLTLLGEKTAKEFYSGKIANAIVNAVNHSPVNSAQLTHDDLKDYVVIKRDPIYGNYRGVDILAPGIPTSGGIILIEALKILETFDLPSLGWDSQALHYVAEAQKLAFMDRAKLGDQGLDPELIQKLISNDYANKISKNILPQKALHKKSVIPDEGMQTTHISITDRAGNLVSWTSTIEGPFGSGITVPGYGFLLNNELTDFDAEPWDAQGKLKANAPGPRKRPLSSTTPAFLFHKGNPYMIVGSPGGTTIIGTVLNTIINTIDFAMPCDEAVAKERLIYRGNKIEMEPLLFNHPFIRLQLELWSHDVEKVETIGNAQVVCFDARYQNIVGVSDPRGEGSAAGF